MADQQTENLGKILMKYYIQPLVIALIFLSTTVVMANQSSVFDYQRFGHVVASPNDKTVAYIAIRANPNVKNPKSDISHQ